MHSGVSFYFTPKVVYCNMKTLRKECRIFLDHASATAEQESKSGNITDIYAEIIETLDLEKLKSYNDILPAPKKIKQSKYQDHNISKGHQPGR